MAVLLHAVPLAGVCRKERSSAVPPVRAGPEEMRCVGSKRTPEMGRDMLLAASIVKFSGPKGDGGNRTVCRGLLSRFFPACVGLLYTNFDALNRQ